MSQQASEEVEVNNSELELNLAEEDILDILNNKIDEFIRVCGRNVSSNDYGIFIRALVIEAIEYFGFDSKIIYDENDTDEVNSVTEIYNKFFMHMNVAGEFTTAMFEDLLHIFYNLAVPLNMCSAVAERFVSLNFNFDNVDTYSFIYFLGLDSESFSQELLGRILDNLSHNATISPVQLEGILHVCPEGSFPMDKISCFENCIFDCDNVFLLLNADNLFYLRAFPQNSLTDKFMCCFLSCFGDGTFRREDKAIVIDRYAGDDRNFVLSVLNQTNAQRRRAMLASRVIELANNSQTHARYIQRDNDR